MSTAYFFISHHDAEPTGGDATPGRRRIYTPLVGDQAAGKLSEQVIV
jgi:hypothetical protein